MREAGDEYRDPKAEFRAGDDERAPPRMTFLQPNILWALPLLLLPVVIHLINRMRHRPQPWAAMMFLVAATRASTNRARLKQWLVLLFRTLAVLTLILFLARPLGGGWLGWAVNAAPDVIFIVLDRSASMESRLPGQTITRREQALKLLAESAANFSETSHFVLLDSATRQPAQLATASALLEASLTGPTDTAADLPGLLQIAHKWLVENRAGTTEIWIASDLQASNWQPDDDRWESLTAQFTDMPQPVRFRLLTFGEDTDLNRSVTLATLERPTETPDRLKLEIELSSAVPSEEKFPVQLQLGESASREELQLNATSFRWQKQFDLTSAESRARGSVTLPADGNERDNQIYFVAEPPSAGAALLVTTEPDAHRFTRLAAMSPGEHQPAAVARPESFAGENLTGIALIIWQAPVPTDTRRLTDFVEQGGVVLFLPPSTGPGGTFARSAWGQPESLEQAISVPTWNERDGPLAATDEGLTLAVDRIAVRQRRLPNTTDTALATFADGSPFLTRGRVGRGAYFHLATLPTAAWSNLERGDVLVPMLQRLLQLGARRLSQPTMIACGELSLADRAQDWRAIDTAEPRDIRLHAGLYQAGDRVVAVNRPFTENEREHLAPASARELFGSLPVRLSAQQTGVTATLEGEVWRLFLFGMLAFLLVESWLILPDNRPAFGTAFSRAQP